MFEKLKAAALAATQYETVTLHQYDGITVDVMKLNTGERSRFELSVNNTMKDSGVTYQEAFRVCILRACCVDPVSLKEIFLDQDFDEIASLPTDMTEPLVNAAVRLNHFLPTDTKEREKN